jgi:hypothetical protein
LESQYDIIERNRLLELLTNYNPPRLKNERRLMKKLQEE